MASSRRTTVQAAGLVLAGAVAGGVLAATVVASAGTSPATVGAGTYGGPSASYAASGPDGRGPDGRGPDGRGPDGRGPGRRPPMQNGTVTAVGTSSITITSASGTKTYAVDANSDIDNNGEAKLTDLKAGDAVHFAVRPGTSTIAVVHAGDEEKNMPTGGRHHDGPCPGGRMGPRPGASPSASPSSNA